MRGYGISFGNVFKKPYVVGVQPWFTVPKMNREWSSGFTMEKLMRSDVPDHVSYAPAVSVVGALMAHSVISALLGRPEEGLTVVDVSAGSVRKVPVH